MTAQSLNRRPREGSRVILRCPRCGKGVPMPARSCPHCRVDLEEATAPPKPKKSVPWLIGTWLTALIFFGITGWLIYCVATGTQIVPDQVKRFVSDKVGVFMETNGWE